MDTPFYVQNGYGYDRGYQHLLELPTQAGRPQRTLSAERRASEVDYCAKTFWSAERALERVYRDRFFLMVDTWDPHEPWDPPEWYVRPYAPDWDKRAVPPPVKRAVPPPVKRAVDPLLKQADVKRRL